MFTLGLVFFSFFLKAVLRGELEVSNKDAFMLASLWLQATRGDYDEERDKAAVSLADYKTHLWPALC